MARDKDPSGSETISVAIATYNGARFLSEQLDSIKAQTRPPDELIIADDCSTDDSVAIARQFASQSAFPVRVIHYPRNVGILENFYSAFRATSGSMIFYCDQDDVWRPDKIEKVLESFDDETMMVMHQSEIVGENLEPQHRSAPGNPRYGNIPFPADTASIHGYGHQMAFRRPVFDLMQQLRNVIEPLAPNGFAHDLDQYIPFCASLLGGLVLLPDTLVSFRRHGAATSPAGSAFSQPVGKTDRAEKARYLVETDVERSALRLATLRAAIDQGVIAPSLAVPLLKAFSLKERRTRRQHVVVDNRGIAATGPVTAMTARLLARGRFSNDRPLRALGLSILLACSSSR
jgi:hypothetical protein